MPCAAYPPQPKQGGDDLRYEGNTEERGNRIANDRVIVAAQYRF
jgi:hypothetical protein